MSKQDDEQAARVERARRIGLFRYMLIRGAVRVTDPRLPAGADKSLKDPKSVVRWVRPRREALTNIISVVR